MIKYEKNIDNRENISENFHEFLLSLVKRLKIKFLHSMKRSMRMLSFKIISFKMTSNHEDFSSRQHSEEVALCFIKKLALIILKNSQEKTCLGVFF